MTKCGAHAVRDVLVTVALMTALQVAAALFGLYGRTLFLPSGSCRPQPGSNGLARPRSFMASEGNLQVSPRQRQFVAMGQPHYQFVHFSVYRESLTTFYVVGLTSRLTRDYDKPVHSCIWHPGAASALLSNTTAEVDYIRHDEHDVPYGVAVVRCTFQDIVRSNGSEGGRLYITVASGPPVGMVQQVLVNHEQPTSDTGMAHLVSRSRPFKHKYAFCGPPIAGEIRQDWIRQWLTYHLHVFKGQAHFFFYNVGGLSMEGRTLLEPFVQAGFVTITEVMDDRLFPSWYHAQVLFINDCLHRTRFLADWTLFYDFDEFLYLKPGVTLDSVLEAHENASILTLGNWPVGTVHCRPASNDDEWPVQRMVFKKQPGPECRKPEEHSIWLCPGSMGRRKMIVDPLKVFTAGVHRAVRPGKSEEALDAAVVRLDHFRGMLSARSRVCPFTWNTSDLSEKYFSLYVKPEDTLSVEIALARESVPLLYLTHGRP